MVSSTQLAWKIHFLLLILTLTNTLVGFICITLPILALFLIIVLSLLLPFGLLIFFRVRILNGI